MTGESESLLEGTLISHLLELRTRLMRAFIAVILVFIPFAFYSNQLFEWLSHPLLQQLPANSVLISTSITAPVFLTACPSWPEDRGAPWSSARGP